MKASQLELPGVPRKKAPRKARQRDMASEHYERDKAHIQQVARDPDHYVQLIRARNNRARPRY